MQESTLGDDFDKVIGSLESRAAARTMIGAKMEDGTLRVIQIVLISPDGINSAGQIVGIHVDSEGGPNRGFLAQPGNKGKP